MVDGLVPFGQPVLIKRRDLAELSFQLSVTVLGELFLKSDKYDLEREEHHQLLLLAGLPTVSSGGMQ